MAVTVREQIAPSWYTPGSEKAESNPTRFRVRPLNGVERLEVFGELSTDKKTGTTMLTAKGVTICASYGVIGWDGPASRDASGKDRLWSASTLRMLEPMLIHELGLHVFNITELGADAEKNSLPQSE